MRSSLALGAIALGCLLAMPAAAQDMAAKKEKKLSGEWLKKAEWNLDFAAAKEAAAKSGKPIFAYFSRSYAP